MVLEVKGVSVIQESASQGERNTYLRLGELLSDAKRGASLARRVSFGLRKFGYSGMVEDLGLVLIELE